MVTGSISVSTGQQVTTATKLGVMGATGNVTGVHLHLECSTTASWNYDTFVNPADELGIPNQRGTIVKYDGASPPTPPTPPTPPSTREKKKFPWFIYWSKRNLKS